MKRCSVRPYEGKEKFIFISYCHKDRAFVFPIIEQLAKDGFRVWYDEGINPGTEWPEVIAQHLNDCMSCIAFISEKSINSHNCRREINFALLKRKHFISVVLESVQMPLGMELQLSVVQSIFKYKMDTEYEFFKKLYDASELKVCQGSPDPSIVVYDVKDYLIDDFDTERTRDPFSDAWFGNDSEEKCRKQEEEKRQRQIEAERLAEEERKKQEEEERQRQIEAERLAEEERKRQEEEERQRQIEAERLAEEERKKQEEEERQRQIEAERFAEEERKRQEEEERQRQIEAECLAEEERKKQEEERQRQIEVERLDRGKEFVLKRMKTGEVFKIVKGSYTIGRSVTLADCLIEGNRKIGRTHAKIVVSNIGCYLVDNHSLNRTYINNIPLEPDVKYLLENGDDLRFADEFFKFYIME